jgi:transcriptional regulator with XRE-family HTH domain
MPEMAMPVKSENAPGAIDVTGLGRLSFRDRLRYVVAAFGGIANAAERLGIKPRTLSRYLAGETSPDHATLMAMADLAGVSLTWLAAGGDAENGNPAVAAALPPVRITLPGEALLQLVRALAVDLPQPVRDAIADALRTPPDTPAE